MADSPPFPRGRAIIVVDLAFGDCGKGTIVDYLARQRPTGSPCTVVRFNGGPQAGHNVVAPGGRHHTFSQFGAGSFVPGVRTFLSRYMLIEPYAMFNEAAHLESLGIGDIWDRLTIDARCTVITPPQQAANRLRELARGAAAHGTCGMGVGEAMQDRIDHPGLTSVAGELADRTVVAEKLHRLCDLKAAELGIAMQTFASHPVAALAVQTLTARDWVPAAVDNYAELASRAQILPPASADAALRAGGTLLFEGAQGVLLDERFGFHPHTTWSNTTFANAVSLLGESGFNGEVIRLGVLRSYFTRHGAGPFVSQDDALRDQLPEPHNNDAGWQGRFRAGLFDMVAAKYALEAAGPIDALALTHLDRLNAIGYRFCRNYWCDGSELTAIHTPENASPTLTAQLLRCRPGDIEHTGSEEGFIASIERGLGTSVVITSKGPTASDKQVSNRLMHACLI